MNVSGLLSDSDPTAPFAARGDGITGLGVLFVSILAARAWIGLPWWVVLVALGVLVLAGFGGVKLRLLSGDILDPVGPWRLKPHKREYPFLSISPDEAPSWFNAVPASVRRLRVDTPMLPFASVILGRFGFYAGWKLYGVDSPEYQDFPGVSPADVYSGSQALCLSVRFTTNRPSN